VFSKTKKVISMKVTLKKIRCPAMVKKLGPRMVALSKESSLKIKRLDPANKHGLMVAIIKAS
jgi:hypothetical protein